jgi:hypothetical protein
LGCTYFLTLTLDFRSSFIDPSLPHQIFYISQMPTDRLDKFSSKLAGGNICETVRFAVTECIDSNDDDDNNHCDVHTDDKNDPRFPRVCIFSRLFWYEGRLFRISIICYSRKSIGDYLLKSSNEGQAIQWLLDGYTKLSANSPPLSSSWLTSLDYSTTTNDCCWKDVGCAIIAPNLDPAVFHSLMVGCILKLDSLFGGLSFFEYHSLLSAFAYIPGAPFFVVIAAMNCCKRTGVQEREEMFAYAIVKEAIKLWHLEGTGAGRPQRYNMYSDVPVPTRAAFKKTVQKFAKTSLLVHRDFPTKPKSLGSSRTVYKRVVVLLKDSVDNLGVLGTNHMLGVGSILGLFPRWMYAQCLLDPACRTYTHLCKKYNCTRGMEGATSFFKTLLHKFLKVHHIDSGRKVENIACKVYQSFGAKKCKKTCYRDVILKR